MPRRFWRRAVIATLLMVVALLATGALGVWQYTRAHRDDLANAALTAAPVAVTELARSGDYLAEANYGRRALLAGQLDLASCFVADQQGRTGPWQVCRFTTESGLNIAVALGMGAAAVKPQQMQLPESLQGRIQPAQEFTPLPALYSAKPAVNYINTDDLSQRWQTDVADGFVVAAAGVSEEYELAPIPDSELLLPPAGIELRNLFYAWQWWIFAGFAIFIWIRYLRDEWHSLADAA